MALITPHAVSLGPSGGHDWREVNRLEQTISGFMNRTPAKEKGRNSDHARNTSEPQLTGCFVL
jgi:hypothetical protein